MASAGLSMASRDAEEWQEIEKYAEDQEARCDAGRRGRAHVDANHGQERVLAQWDELFRSVLP
jgi:hypothetical protein